jgi:hypothetical protein
VEASFFPASLYFVWKTTATKDSGGKSIQLSYLSKSKDTLIEHDSSKSESYPDT